VYVAAPLPLLLTARVVAVELHARGIVTTSSWHTLPDDPTPEKERAMTLDEQEALANTCLSEISESDALLLLVGPRNDRSGNIGEAFFAAGLGKPVFVLPMGPDAPLPTVLLTADLFHKPLSLDTFARLLKHVPVRP